MVLKGNAIAAIDELGRGAIKNNFSKDHPRFTDGKSKLKEVHDLGMFVKVRR